MRANPGGEIALGEVIGRDRLIRRLWQTLDQQSIVLIAERRMGKTSVIKKMAAECPDDRVTLYRDVEGLDTPHAFAERVYHDLEAHLDRSHRTAGRARQLLQQIGGAEIGGIFKLPPAVAPHWKALIETVVEDLIEHCGRSAVIFWDELPLMLQKIRRTSGSETAMEVLDLLRSLRQTHSELRMVFSGSIGLHHVTSSLSDAGHTNAAVNDMRIVEVPPLEAEDAEQLCRMLFEGEGLACDDPEATARAVASSVDGIPFYVHHVVSALRDRGDAVTEQMARDAVGQALVDPMDVWHLDHYRARLKEYYGEVRLPVVFSLLDEIARTDDSITKRDLRSRLASTHAPADEPSVRLVLIDKPEELARVLRLLERDHYVRRDATTGAYRFRFGLIKRWWRLSRDLVA